MGVNKGGRMDMAKMKVAKQLMTPSDLSEKGRGEIAVAVNPLVADAFALYVKTKSFHWHVYGHDFRDKHLLFDEQAEQIFAMIDVLAERVRKLGAVTVRSVGDINHLKRVKDDAGALLTAEQMVKQLMKDNLEFVKSLREVHEVCSKHGDCATTSILEILIDEGERRIWFLFEASQG